MRRVLFIAILFSTHLFSFAQDGSDAAVRKASEHAGFEFSFEVGSQFNHWTGLNNQLKAGGLTSESGGMFSLGLGTAVRLGPVIFGDDIDFLSSPDGLGSSFVFYLSTNELTCGKWIFSPVVGYGWQYTRMHVGQPNGATTFQGALTGPYNEVEVDHEGDFLDLGMTFKLHFNKNEKLYMPVFRAGYRVGLGNNAWTVGKNSFVTDGPRDNAGNFYLEVLVGFGQ
jgi:hypothetical protein